MTIRRSLRHIVLASVILLGSLLFVQSSKIIAKHLVGGDDWLSSFSNSDPSNAAWFVAHPILAIAGSVILPVPAIILRKYKGYWSKKIHAYVFGLSLIALFLSLYIAFVHKDVRGKDHLVSLHAKAGAFLAASYLVLAMVGLLALDPDFARVIDKTRKTNLKWIHKSGGRELAVVGYWICFSGWVKFFDGPVLWVGGAVAFVATFLTYLDPLVDTFFSEGKVE
jgi:hypothetical protein